jgi:hypothetical protein
MLKKDCGGYINKEVKTTMIEALSNFFGAIASALWGKKSKKRKSINNF